MFHDFHSTANGHTMDTMTPKQFATIRADARMTQAEIAAFLDVGLRAAQRWEYGERSVPGPAAVLMRMLKQFPVETLRMREGIKP